MLTPEEVKATIEFLDRSALKGHTERQAMNLIVSKLQQMAQPPAPADLPEPVKKPADKAKK